MFSAKFEARGINESEFLRIDSVEKVTGKVKYTTDLIEKDALYLRVVRSPYPHAFVKGLDKSLAEKVTGVTKVLTAKDIPGVNEIGFFIQDQPVMCDTKVRYIGDAVAMIVADSPEAAQLGVEAVKVQYEPLPGIFDPRDSLQTGATRIHEKGNLIDSFFIRKGDASIGLEKADIVVEGTYRTPIQEHAYLETEAAIGIPTEDGITVIACLQVPFAVEKAVRRVLGKAVKNVRIVQAPTGGAFGGKEDAPDDVAARVALAAYHTKKPVLLAYSREESIVCHPKRHAGTINREMGITKEGKITAVKSDILLDGGAYASLSSRVLFQAVCSVTGPYDVPNVHVDGHVAYTNNVPAGAFRGFGKPQGHFAAELQMDEAAERLGLDPMEFRLKNILRVGSVTATGQKLTDSVGLEECLLKAVEASSWKTEHDSKKKQGLRRRGMGMACMIHPTSIGPLGVDVGSAIVEIADDESVIIKTGITEYGQGTYTGFVRIVQRLLGLNKTSITVEYPDTTRVLDSGPTVASRGTAVGGKGVYLAAQQLRDKMAAVAAELLSCSVQDLVFENDTVRSSGSISKEITLATLAKECRKKGIELRESAWYKPTGLFWDQEKGQGSPWVSYSWATHIAEVEVDMDTGKVDVLNYVAAHDSGHVIVPTQLKSQIYGGVVQGIGYAMMEELLLNKGQIRNPNFTSYYIPTAADIPKVTPIVVEFPDRYGPFGAKGIGEPSIEPVAAAIGNAVYNAIGIPVREFPFTAERVYEAIKSQK